MMRLSQKGEKLLKDIECLSLFPYDDQKGIKSAPIKNYCVGATIGYGYLIPPQEWNKYKDGITLEQAQKLFEYKISFYEKGVRDNIKVPLEQNQFDALVLLCYNIGVRNFSTSSVCKIINGLKGNYNTLEDAWMAWTKSQNKVMQGLINRRNAELDIFYKNEYHRW